MTVLTTPIESNQGYEGYYQVSGIKLRYFWHKHFDNSITLIVQKPINDRIYRFQMNLITTWIGDICVSLNINRLLAAGRTVEKQLKAWVLLETLWIMLITNIHGAQHVLKDVSNLVKIVGSISTKAQGEVQLVETKFFACEKRKVLRQQILFQRKK